MNLRAIAVILLVTGLLAIAVLGPRWLFSKNSSTDDAPLHASESCDLLAGTCSWKHNGGLWQASMTLAREDTTELFRLEVKGPDTGERLTGILRGQTMYLGEYPVPLARNEAGDGWNAEFVPPVCTLEPNMTWRIDINKGQTLMPAENQSITLVFSYRSAALKTTKQG
ncbi:hypothetical protein [Marinobacter salicampi]|uniref:hypothetical protein n=1 Tax=Marinobacter salicampi TaxID=435907 RepID=UPI00140D53A6|nr:hypothetical protein [Marinobacter salicampi]